MRCTPFMAPITWRERRPATSAGRWLRRWPCRLAASSDGRFDTGLILRVQYTQTGVPTGARLLAQIQSMASSLTRTQPCETGNGGT